MTKGTTALSFKYNSSGLRTEKMVDGVATKYTYLNGKVAFKTNGTETIHYSYDGKGTPFSMAFGGNEYFYTINNQGDVTGLRDAAGSQVVSYTYDTWGKLISIDGSLKDTLGVKNPYRYRGYRYDTETGLYYLQSRYYNPEIGRFINADNAEVLDGGNDHLLENNLFTYCMNNPVNMTDDGGAWPSWVKKIVIGTAIIAGAALIVATAGTGTVLACFATGALKGAAIGAATGAVSGGTSGALSHRLRKGTWRGAGRSALNGAADGYMWGAATGFISGGLTSKVCFVAGTPVLSAAGHVAIEDIREGDLVWAQDPETGEKALKRVVQTFVNETTELVRITVNEEIITSTPEHPFYVKNKGWTSAEELRIGDVFLTHEGYQPTVEERVQSFTVAKVKVYNFEVEDYNTYFVGTTNVLVHNMCAKKTSGNIERMGVSRGNAPRSNQAQNQQINRIVKDLGLSKSQRKLLHQEINKQGYGYQEILKIAKDLFKK